MLTYGDTGIVDLKDRAAEENRENNGIKCPIDMTLEDVEREQIFKLFNFNGRKVKVTARALGIDVKTLRKKLIKYGIRDG
jgi:DNA-binding NtrC family response regulator